MALSQGIGTVPVRWLAAGLAAVFLALAGTATAARPPTLTERASITVALPAFVQRYPVGCVWLDVMVSSSAHFAKVVPDAFYPARAWCLRYAANGFYILKKTRQWHMIFNGSVSPRCSLRIPRDLLGSLGCRP